MIEGLREHGWGLLGERRAYSHAVLADFAFPYIDLVYTFAFPIGLVLAAFGNFAIVGPLTLAVLPLNCLLADYMFHLSQRTFTEVGLHVRRNRLGFFAYLFLYQLFMSPVSVTGYAQEIFRTRARW